MQRGLLGMAILAIAAVGQSLGVQLSMAQAALIASGVALAGAVPAGPSNLGTFEFAAVAVGQAVGIAREQSFALALDRPRRDPARRPRSAARSRS